MDGEFHVGYGWIDGLMDLPCLIHQVQKDDEEEEDSNSGQISTAIMGSPLPAHITIAAVSLRDRRPSHAFCPT